ncbi:unnamed protein product [Acanthoscelides obtectus]|uniref:Kinesin motor domain-containing protein n=1 Tax=Acanthoscelides obtectus TaxID=200917 RepID=A0A9P0QEQ2_ACAOB|nr:unnamed protein product [Acanthoscelides obtectus]CAK1689407.1 Centromere-associated protein E [Acanthoscelides obtectus]
MIHREVADGLERLWNVRVNCIWEADESSRHGEVYIFDHVLSRNVQIQIRFLPGGFHAAIFAYGQTSLAKHTPFWAIKTDPGLFQLVSNQLFQHVADQVDKSYSLNERSSRSHTIFRIILESKDANQKDGPVHISYLNLMDLAGSERVSLTKACCERNVIRQLSEGKEFISYRDSKLTRLLSQALGGNAKSLIIGNVTLAAEEETRSTPEFAQSTKTVKNKTKVNILSATEETLQGYQNLTRDLETRLKKQAIKLKEMDKSKQEYLLEIERLKTEVSIVGRFQMGASASTPKKTLRRHTFGHYGNVSPKKASLGYMPLKNYPPKEESSGREMRPIQEETYEEALAEAESVIAEDVQVYLKDNSKNWKNLSMSLENSLN